MPRFLRVKNYERYQHYKDRNPPWIKLHRSVLLDVDFLSLADSTKAHLLLLWIAASQNNNRLPDDAIMLQKMIRVHDSVDLATLKQGKWLLPWTHARAQGNYEAWPSRYVSLSVRQAVLQAAHFQCQACGQSAQVAALEVDHIVPVSQGGTSAKSNLQALCLLCNRRKRQGTLARPEQRTRATSAEDLSRLETENKKTDPEISDSEAPKDSASESECVSFSSFLTDLPDQESSEHKAGQKKRRRHAPALVRSAAVWEAYAARYQQRYGVLPVRHAGVNAMLCKVIDKLGAEEAPLVAAFYLTHNKPIYVQSRHPTTLLLRDAEGLRTEWATGIKATTLEAREAERGDAAHEQIRRVEVILARTKGPKS